MGQYVVQLEGGGEMRVNASSPQAAAANVSSTGNTPAANQGGGGSTSSSGGGETVYNTVNGPRTASQMAAELTQVGWPGGEDPVAAYQRTTGGAVSTSGTGGSAPTSGGSTTAVDGQSLSGQSAQTQADYASVYGGNAATQWAVDHNAAIGQPSGGSPSVNASTAGATTSGATASTPQKPVPSVPTTNLDAFNTAVSQASAQAYQAYLNSKLQLDNDTLAFQKAQQAFSETISKANLTGMFEGAPTLANLKQQADLAAQAAGLSGMFQGQPTLAAQGQYFNQGLALQTQNQKTVQDYLNLIAGLRGPQDYGQYLRTLASTPQGLQSLVGAASGQMGRVTGFGTTGVPQNPATLGGIMGAGATGGAATGTTYEDYQKAAQGLPPPSQIAPQAWNSMTDSQKQLLMGMYESTGWNLTDAQQQYAASLPKFGSSGPQAGTVRLV